MAGPPFNTPREIVDLASHSEASDSEDNVLSGDELRFFDAQAERQGEFPGMSDDDDFLEELDPRHPQVPGPAQDIIDLTGIPDIDIPPSTPAFIGRREAAQPSNHRNVARIITENECLQMVMDVLPDIAISHVLELIRKSTTDLTRTAGQCEDLITQLLDGEAYPKEADEAKNNKRKREDDDDWKEYEKAERHPAVASYESDA